MASSRSTSTDSTRSTITPVTDAKETRSDSGYATSHERPALETWVSDPISATIYAARASRYAAGPEGEPRYCPSVPKDVTSMFNARLAMRSSDRGSVPSLDQYSRTISASSNDSLEAEYAVQDGGLDEEGQVIDYNLAPAQAPPAIKCLFDFLGCDKVLESLPVWNEHSKSHLRGRSPPTDMACPLQSCAEKFKARNGETAWNDCWGHIQSSHDIADLEQETWRADASMIQFLHNNGLIRPSQYKELRSRGRCGADTSSVVSSQSATRHRRREGGEPRSGRARR